MGWRDKARQALEGGHNRHDRAQKVEKAPNVPNVPNVPASPERVLRFWHSKLSALDPLTVPDGFEAREWRQLIEDCHWLYEGFASAAVRDGWDAQALWGCWVGYAPAGGLAQQLRGSRQIVFDGPRAVYRQWGVACPVNIGIARGLRAVWEIAQ